MKRFFKWAAILILLALALLFQFAYWTSKSGCEAMNGATGTLMKAVVYCDYGSPNVLKVTQIAKPRPDETQVLVKVQFASINPYDWHFMRGKPYIMRMASGLRKPKSGRLGVDFAGTVEAVGTKVTSFKPGDEVFSGKLGALAEYIVINERNLVRKPENISSEQAAAVYIAGVTALQALRDKGKLQPGERVLINGASGGVGTFAVQIAKTLGGDVTAVCSKRNVDLVRSLGADHVIDYTQRDFTEEAEEYDVILDMVGNHGLLASRRVLSPHGRYVMVGGVKGTWIAPLDTVLLGLVLSPFIRQKMGFMIADANPEDMARLRDLIAAGKLTPVIDRRYQLDEIADAMRYLEEGHARGKVVIALE